MNRKEMLLKAQTDYPIGTVFKSAWSQKEGIIVSEIEKSDQYFDGDIFCESEQGIMVVYDATLNKWAEIVSKP